MIIFTNIEAFSVWCHRISLAYGRWVGHCPLKQGELVIFGTQKFTVIVYRYTKLPGHQKSRRPDNHLYLVKNCAFLRGVPSACMFVEASHLEIYKILTPLPQLRWWL